MAGLHMPAALFVILNLFQDPSMKANTHDH